MYNIIFRTPALKFLKKLKKQDKKKVFEKINKLKNNPYLGKRLSGNLFGLWGLRFDKFRIIYEVKENEITIYIMNIGHRKDIYN